MAQIMKHIAGNFDLTLLMGSIEPIRQNIFNVQLDFVTGEHSFLGKTLYCVKFTSFITVN
ncbi:hypothetical protein BLA29_012662 [Euroglyphus maynei]|uniref:Uncharacterized protein n=1 Tax=Euroglyphus maynei TaxID=6958 RepID=A0A1Y3BHH3_EURMA|nr:hypothetical protein BLA29_012662 [Euroglyphus maynei]